MSSSLVIGSGVAPCKSMGPSCWSWTGEISPVVVFAGKILSEGEDNLRSFVEAEFILGLEDREMILAGLGRDGPTCGRIVVEDIGNGVTILA